MGRIWGSVIAGLALAALAVGGAGCGHGDPHDGPAPFLAFGCGTGQRFLACFASPDSALLVAPDGLHRLARIRAASGARYADATDTLWTKGEQAMLIRRDGTLKDCQPTGRHQVLADLWREGALFTAAGNEPFWTLTAWPDSLVLLRDLGGRRLRHRLDAAHPWQGAAVGWEDPDAGISIATEQGPCLDTMNGAPYPWRVSVRWDGEDLTGCGLDLRPTR